MAWSENELRVFWRTKYPWLFVVYIILMGVLRGLLSDKDPSFAMDMLMIGAFSSYVFLHIFYLYGVKPQEIEKLSHKNKK